MKTFSSTVGSFRSTITYSKAPSILEIWRSTIVTMQYIKYYLSICKIPLKHGWVKYLRFKTPFLTTQIKKDGQLSFFIRSNPRNQGTSNITSLGNCDPILEPFRDFKVAEFHLLGFDQMKNIMAISFYIPNRTFLYIMLLVIFTLVLFTGIATSSVVYFKKT